ncbi:MAG: hypothetical protein V4642_01510 [Bacteroidota bacterium]
MKYFLKNILVILFLLGSSGIAFAQIDTISTIIVTNIEQPDTNEILFDLVVTRNSDAWSVWANGTYQVTISGNLTIDPLNQSLEYVAETSELFPIITTFAQPLKGYIISPVVLPGRLSISILGPDEYSDGIAVTNRTGQPTDTLKLGTFRLLEIQNRKFPDPAYFSWYLPYSRYQAHAFKKQSDSSSTGALWYAANDNVEMNNYTTRVRYVVDTQKIKPTNDVDFIASYDGAGQVELSWKTTNEYFNRGFILRRGIRSADQPTITFDQEIGNFLNGVNNVSLPDTGLISKSRKGRGAEYRFSDVVEERGVQYVYELTDVSSAEAFLALNPGMHDRDTTGVIIPSSVISSAEVGPNPVVSKARVSFFVEGKVTISIKLTNLVGKDIVLVLENATYEAGEQFIDFTVDELASNGLYNIVIVATPIDQENNGGLGAETRVIVPVQLIR